MLIFLRKIFAGQPSLCFSYYITKKFKDKYKLLYLLKDFFFFVNIQPMQYLF